MLELFCYCCRTPPANGALFCVCLFREMMYSGARGPLGDGPELALLETCTRRRQVPNPHQTCQNHAAVLRAYVRVDFGGGSRTGGNAQRQRPCQDLDGGKSLECHYAIHLSPLAASNANHLTWVDGNLVTSNKNGLLRASLPLNCASS